MKYKIITIFFTVLYTYVYIRELDYVLSAVV